MSYTPASREECAKKFALPGERLHTVTQYSNTCYKITQHYAPRQFFGPGPVAEFEHSDVKLSSSLSRTKRSLLELALSNDWEYFVTFTLSEENLDRFDLDGWHRKFKEWIKYRRKAHGLKCRYLLVPEQHKNGAWHAHGLMAGNMDLVSFKDLDAQGYRSKNGFRLPEDVRESNYMNWFEFMDDFGFCSLGPLRSQEAAALYIQKYITKDLERCVSECGKHMYWPSRPLNRPRKFGEFVDRNNYIDGLLRNKYEFCATGLVLPSEFWDSETAAGLIEAVGGSVFDGAGFRPFWPEQAADKPSPAELEADAYAQFEQLAFGIEH